MADTAVLKCVVVGDGAVGKTSLIAQAISQDFDDILSRPLFENYSVPIMITGKNLNLCLCDTGAEEDHNRQRIQVYQDTTVAILCFSIISPPSYQNCKTKWIQEIRQYCGNSRVLLVGTKSDLRTNSQMLQRLAERNAEPISIKQGKALAKEIGAFRYIELCSLDENCGELLLEVLRTALESNNTSSSSSRKDRRSSTNRKSRCDVA